jgi:RHS repeat-associated protein
MRSLHHFLRSRGFPPSRFRRPSSITYPSGRVVAQTFDNIGRLSQITSSSVNYLTVASSSGYNAANEVLSATYGNGVAATFGYNARLQLASLAYAKSGANLFSLAYNYGAGNNGQIQSITDNVDNGRTVNYTYDAWSRLKTSATIGSAAYPAWGLSWSYDRYGNRKQQTVTAGSNMPSNSVTPSPTTNRITDAGYAYDLAGNMTNDGSNTLTYDAENRVTNSANGGSSGAYAFDGNSLRVQKTVSGATTLYIFSGTKVIAEYASGAAPSSPSKEYIYTGSQLLATIAGSTTNYHIADHLSPRVTTDSAGSIVGQQAHFPFGEDWYASSSTTKFKFTSYERDSESGNDYAMMRTSINRLGRFSSPDPLAGSILNPQSLNRYAYVLNDPPNLADPFGLDGCEPSPGPDGIIHCDVSAPFPDGGGADPGGLFGGGGAGGPIRQPLLDTPEVQRGGSRRKRKPKDPCDENDPTNKKILDFIRAHLGDAQAIATQLNTAAANILGLSGEESSYGTDYKIPQTNNYFSLHPHAPGEVGVYPPGAKNINNALAVFPPQSGYATSAQAFAARWGNTVNGKTDPAGFANALLQAGYTGLPPQNPAFAKLVTDTINSILARLDCPQLKKH